MPTIRSVAKIFNIWYRLYRFEAVVDEQTKKTNAVARLATSLNYIAQWEQ